MKKIYIIFLIIITVLFVSCKRDYSKAPLPELLDHAHKLQKELNSNPDNIIKRASCAEAYQRIGDHFKYIDESISSIAIENLNKDDAVLIDLHRSLYKSLFYYYLAAYTFESDTIIDADNLINKVNKPDSDLQTIINSMEEIKAKLEKDGQFEYEFILKDGKREVVFTHKDPEVVKVYNKIRIMKKNDGEINENLLSKEERLLVKEWSQRLNKVVHYKLGLTYRSLVSVFIAYKNSSLNNDKITLEDKEENKKWNDKAVSFSLEAEKQYKIAVSIDPEYKKAWTALAKLYLYMYESFSEEKEGKISLQFATEIVYYILNKLDNNNIDALFIKAKIETYLGKYEMALGTYEKKLLKLLEKDSDQYNTVITNISKLRDMIADRNNN